MKRTVALAASVFAFAACADDGDTIATHDAPLGARKPFFVGFRAPPTAADEAMLRAHGANVNAVFANVNAIAVDLDEARIGDVARQGGVAYVEADPPRYKSGLADAELTPSLGNGLYGLVTTGAVGAHANGVTGAGIKACVADTSIDYDHPDILPQWGGGIDTVGAGDSDPINDDGETHGTHVAGTILGAINGEGVRGVAPEATLYHARVLGPNGGSTSDIMQGVQWLADQGCHIVNLSLGGGLKSRTEENFYKSMRALGVLVVAATGNDAKKAISFPAGYAVNIAVGAVDVNNAIASFSNVGKNIDISGPGVMVLSSVPQGSGSEAGVTNNGKSFTAFGMEFAPPTDGVTGTLVDCGLGQVGEFPAAVAGNIALIERGTNSFADKVTNAKNAGAKAVIISNNAPGNFNGTLGAEGAWIPAVSVSDEIGKALQATLGTTTVVDMASDWAYMDGTSMATPHVSGGLALILDAYNLTTLSKANADFAEQKLKAFAKDLGARGYDTTFGFGLMQLPLTQNMQP